VIPTHADRVGGVGFLANTVHAFSVLAVAHGALLAGPLANRIFFAGAQLTQLKIEIAAVVVFLLCVVLGPLLLFAPQLAASKFKGLREYGTLASRYAREFDTKWLRGGAPADTRLLGNADVQGLADMTNSYAVVQSMSLVPITRGVVVGLAGAILAPIAPLLLTMMPLGELVKMALALVR
jgi:hypothetical protein